MSRSRSTPAFSACGSAKEAYEGGRFTLAFIGYGDEDSTAVLELTHNWDTDYVLGDAFGHIALGTDDIFATCERIRAGGKIVRGNRN